jgi:hypothetical protein
MALRLKVTANYGFTTFKFPPLPGGLDHKYEVKIKEVTQGDVAKYRNLGKKITYIPREGEKFAQEQEFPGGDLMYARAEICVVDWNLDDEHGKIVPFCREAWDQLPPDWAEWLDDRIEEVNPELTGGTKNRGKTSES